MNPRSQIQHLLLTAVFLAGVVRAQSQTSAPAIDFASLFRAATTNSTVKQIVVADDFEQGLVRRVTRDPAGNETGFRFDAPAPRLRAYLPGANPSNALAFVAGEEQAATGSKSLRLQPQSGIYPTLNWYFYGKELPRRGRFRMSFDLLNNGTADCDINIRAHDSSVFRSDQKRREQTHFSLLCRRGAARLGDSMGLPAGQWRHFDVSFPLGDPAGKAVLRVTEQNNRMQSVECPLEKIANAVSRISLMVTGAPGGRAYLDNLVIAFEE